MSTLKLQSILVATIIALNVPSFAQEKSNLPIAANRPMHQESAAQHESQPSPFPGGEAPPLPEGMTLDEVLDYSASPPPDDFPEPVPDDQLYVFTLFEQLEYRLSADGTPDQLGWKAQGWIGGDFNKFWWKNEGEAIFEGPDEGETETDLLYARLILPFWSLQIGAQYANEWALDDYEDRWSGVIGFQGLAPYKFELDNSLYISEDGDVTFELEAEYDLRLTQRLVLQPRTELGFAFQDISERNLGAGMTDVNLDMRLRYEINRQLAPYIGLRYRFLVGETDNIAKSAGADTEQLFFVTGIRFAF